jgi:hypothetical protein
VKGTGAETWWFCTAPATSRAPNEVRKPDEIQNTENNGHISGITGNRKLESKMGGCTPVA